MLDQLLDSFKGQALETITSKLGLNEKEANDSVDVVGEEIQSSVSNQLSSGNIGGLLNMFDDADGDGIPDVLEGIGENVISSLTSKLGFSSDKSSSIANMIIPMAISFFGDKMKGEAASDSNDFDLGGLITQFAGGGNSKGAGDLLGGLTDSLGGLFGK
ncbi:MAG: hypothetical protein ACPGEC_03825 [Flavobacteriales bacterium]